MLRNLAEKITGWLQWMRRWVIERDLVDKPALASESA
jgi:hypothetical protein